MGDALSYISTYDLLVAIMCNDSLHSPALLKPLAQCAAVDAELARPVSQAMGFAVVGEHSHPSPVGRYRWGGQCLFKSPVLQPVIKRLPVNAEAASPLGFALRLPVVGQHFCSTSICHLLMSRGPNAVFRRISGIIGNPLQRRPFEGPLSHVFEEVKKRLHPARADRDSPGAVVLVGAGLGVVAALLHRLPHLIHRASGMAIGLVMHASTGCGASGPQVMPGNCNGVSAFALTQPAHAVLHIGELKNREFAVTLSCFIFRLRGKLLRIARHLNLLHGVTVVNAARFCRPSGSFSFHQSINH